MIFERNLCKSLIISVFFVVFLSNAFEGTMWGSPGTEVFQDFLEHISAQIEKDKYEFSVADTCTVWFYQHMRKKPNAEVERIHFIPLRATESDLNCVQRYPEGLNAAREAFGQTQQVLSLSLTFFQLALVGDGDDNEEYNPREIQDVLEALRVPFKESQSMGGHLGELTGLFDTIRSEVRFQTLMEGMQTLMAKGYRLTGADQAALNKELE